VLPSQLSDLLDAAASAASWADYERPLFEWLDRSIGFDLAFCVRHGEIGPHAPGLDSQVRRESAGRFEVYAREYEPLRRKALQEGGAAIDVEVFGRATLERTLTYREMMQPHRGRSSLLAFMGGPTDPRVLLVLGRTGTGEFTERDRQQLVAARSLLTVCERAVASRQFAAAAPALSPRERELIQYLRLGYTNREIGAACGTSFRTVRNQLSHLFDKLEVSTRSEAVARSFELALVFE
jgi:DNA-binding CsgD family transcriptional regulator